MGPGQENGWEMCSITPYLRFAVSVHTRAQVRFYELAVQ